MQQKSVCVLLSLLGYLALIVEKATAASFVEEPRSRNASLGELAKFNCSVAAPYLFWIVNGISSDGSVNAGKNIKEEYSSQNGIITSILTVPCNNATNNSKLLCIAFEQGVFVNSSTVLLLVQGTLEAVANLRVTHLTEHMVTFVWDAPHTLVGVPILGYEIIMKLTNLRNDNIVQTINETSFLNELIMTNPFNNGFCTFLNLTISAINMAGMGPSTSTDIHFGESITAGQWSLSSLQWAVISLPMTSVKLNFGTEMIPCNQSLPVSAKLNLTGSLSQSDHVSCNMTEFIQSGNNTSTIMKITLQTSFLCELQLHMSYSGCVKLLDNDSQYAYLPGISFSTFTTTSVSYELLPGQICITCTFLNLTMNVGCYGVVKAMDSVFGIAFLEINHSDELHTACSNELPTAVYELVVYDVDNNGEVPSFPAFVYRNISIKGIDTPTTDVVPTPTATPPVESADSDITVAIQASIFSTTIVLLVVAMVVCASVVILCYRKRKQVQERNAALPKNIMVRDNQAYDIVDFQRCPRTRSSPNVHLQTNSAIALQPCGAYDFITTFNKSNDP